MSGSRPGTAAAVTGMSVPFDAPDGPPTVYANVGSSPLPCTQTLNICVPDAGRVITIGAAPISQLFGEMSGPMKFTLIGVEAAAVVGSVTTSEIPEAEVCVPDSAMALGEAAAGATTNGAGFDNAPFGFCTCTISVPVAATSKGFSAVAHADDEAQLVARAAPLNRITEAEEPLPATKFRPSTSSGKPSTAPAVTLDGKTVSIVGPVFTATTAVSMPGGVDCVVATMAIAFGEGAVPGAVNSPVELIFPHAVPLQPEPGTAEATDHVAGTLEPSGFCTKNCCVLGAPPVAAMKRYCGAMAAGPDGVTLDVIWTCAVALRVESASLVATTLTGFCEGRFPGATNVTLTEDPPVGGAQGETDVVQIWPTLALPFGTPFTDHETFTSDDPVTVGVSVSCCDVAILALVGESETTTPLTIAMDAEAETPPATA